MSYLFLSMDERGFIPGIIIWLRKLSCGIVDIGDEYEGFMRVLSTRILSEGVILRSVIYKQASGKFLNE